MIRFELSTHKPNAQYIGFKAIFPSKENSLTLQLPSWRPGRYELGNFAKNVRNFKVFDQNNLPLSVKKISKDRWLVDTESCSEITVSYEFYAAELNAGSTFLSDKQLYVNPVNCFVFNEDLYNEAIEVKLEIPTFWNIATSLEKSENAVLKSNGFEELFDSPFIASGDLQHNSYESNGVKFHIWFNGEIIVDWQRILKDFQAFTDTQIAKFREFPVEEYHFLNQILPIQAYHGVEHTKSTVIALGPSYDIFGSLYKELLGVSSHELYHTWNVKMIRPVEMQPYDFTQENYSRLGYVYEGVTTYQGDLFLLKSGVFDEKQYLEELRVQFQRHFDNPARFLTSVADSSYDTWLDGYVAGAPARKLSIYTEGCLLAFATDVKILEATNGKYGLDEVMKRLYFNFALNGKGYSEEDYQKEIENIAGISFQTFFDDYINGNRSYEGLLCECLELIGLELHTEASKQYSEARLGFKTLNTNGKVVVHSIFSGAPADMAGLMLKDEIIAINGFMINNQLDKWLRYFDNKTKTISINRGGRLIELTFPEVQRDFYLNYSIKKAEKLTKQQEKLLTAWKS